MRSGCGSFAPHPFPNSFSRPHQSDRPACLENPRPKGGMYLTENGSSPFHAEPGQYRVTAILPVRTWTAAFSAFRTVQPTSSSLGPPLNVGRPSCDAVQL